MSFTPRAAICAECREEIVVTWTGAPGHASATVTCGCNTDYPRSDYERDEDDDDMDRGCSRTVLSYEWERERKEEWERTHGPAL